LGAKTPNPVKVASQIGSGSRDQCRQAGEEILSRKQHMSSAIAERVLEFVADFPIDVRREPLQANRRTRDITTQTFKTLALLRLAGNSRVQ